MKWIEADYFKSFQCKCGDCRQSCCDAWDIAISQKEFVHLSNANCSDDLYQKLQCAFHPVSNPTPERYRVFARNYIGCCPMHDFDGLCRLHKELGAEQLPEICRVFPRSMHLVGNNYKAVCSAGCEAVIEILDRSDSLHFIECEDDLPVDLTLESDPEIVERFSDLSVILRDISLPLTERIAKICKRLSASFTGTEEEQTGFSEFFAALDLLSKYSPTLTQFKVEIGDRYSSFEQYRTDCAEFEKRFPDYSQLFEKILLNHFFYENFPETDPRIDPCDSFYGLCFAYALMRIMCVSRYTGSKEDIIDALTNAYRYIEHSSFYYNARTVIQNPGSLLSL